MSLAPRDDRLCRTDKKVFPNQYDSIKVNTISGNEPNNPYPIITVQDYTTFNQGINLSPSSSLLNNYNEIQMPPEFTGGASMTVYFKFFRLNNKVSVIMYDSTLVTIGSNEL